MTIREFYGRTENGETVERFILQNRSGMLVRCLDYGCRLTHIVLPAKAGGENILLGYDSLAGYEGDPFFMGALIGRYANRIKGATFSLSGKKYALTRSDGENYLHGSFHRCIFKAEAAGENAVLFSGVSPSGEDGFPGELRVRVLYSLDDENRLTAEYRAVCDAQTHVNLTNHAYFDLSAGCDDSVERHLLRLNSGRFLEVGADLCPTGRVRATEGAFDFSDFKAVGRDIEANDPQLKIAGGYDHCFVLETRGEDGPIFAAELSDSLGSRHMKVFTTQPAVQLYTGNFLTAAGAGGFSRRRGLSLETQRYPDSPNHPDFPSTLLRPGEEYREITVYQFEF